MKVFSRPVPTSAANVPTIIGQGADQVGTIGLQAPAANAATIFFGTKDEQPFELRPGANALLPITSGRDLYLYGTSGDKISIGIF